MIQEGTKFHAWFQLLCGKNCVCVIGESIKQH